MIAGSINSSGVKNSSIIWHISWEGKYGYGVEMLNRLMAFLENALWNYNATNCCDSKK